MARTTHDVLSVEWIKLELLRTAYATRGGLLATMDPRAVLAWYVLLALAPWFTHDATVLGLLFAFSVVMVVVSRVGPLVLGLFVVGLLTEGVYLAVAAWLFGGDVDTLMALAELTLKLGVVSLASMAAFVSLDPEKLSDALLALRAPTLVAFGVSYGYRMLPIFMEEFHTIVDGHRLRARPVPSRGLFAWRTVVNVGVVFVHAFYPMMLNTAKRTRTTVEALETRGFTVAAHDPRSRQVRLAHLRVTRRDVVVLSMTLAVVLASYGAGAVHPTSFR
ncbi:energy-coupling factor transporter transmembrane component T family protein [Sanguibacter suaedae]|uniref:Energy-coupling factor transporter transmembrane protein EcfT n=1 Tax=Sanguibacter suaedae TaxID=2795737 RepID=A0A934M6E2_9MICO|nr:energy-coupling factor transporter transmembrane component T [Sanguibacter suaedae]MBI9114147.1 energy-coupling factor transporter transmembrane protein EcfT [Sanguibacter suaedae]